MTVVRFAVELDATPEEVWAVVADPRNLPRWDRHIVAVEGVPEGGLRQGVEYTTVLRFMGVRARVGARALELRPPAYARMQLTGLLDATIVTRITPLDQGRSRLEHEVDFRFRGGPLGRLAAQAVRLLGGAGHLLRRGTVAQKRQVEEGPGSRGT